MFIGEEKKMDKLPLFPKKELFRASHPFSFHHHPLKKNPLDNLPLLSRPHPHPYPHTHLVSPRFACPITCSLV